MVVLLCSVIIWAQAPPPPPPPPPPGYAVGAGGTVPHSAKVVDLIVPVQKYLELTDAQVQQWKDVQATRKQQAEELGLKVRQLEDQLESALSEANPSAAAVGQLVIQLRSARQERGNIWESTLEAVKGILTPAQAEKLEVAKKASDLRQIVDVLIGTGFLAPPPPPPPPPHAPEAPKAMRMPHAPGAPPAPMRRHAPEM